MFQNTSFGAEDGVGQVDSSYSLELDPERSSINRSLQVEIESFPEVQLLRRAVSSADLAMPISPALVESDSYECFERDDFMRAASYLNCKHLSITKSHSDPCPAVEVQIELNQSLD